MDNMMIPPPRNSSKQPYENNAYLYPNYGMNQNNKKYDEPI
jgi:hypothetical protein